MSAITKYFAFAIFTAGSILWSLFGVLLTLRPGGNPHISFRASIDLMPLAGVRLVLIGWGMAGYYNPLKRAPPCQRRLPLCLQAVLSGTYLERWYGSGFFPVAGSR